VAVVICAGEPGSLFANVDASIDRIRGRELIRKGPFARLWWSQAVSSLGDWATLFATFALAAKLSGGGRSASLGILVALVARILPGLVFGLIGGVVADRWDRKKVMIISDLGRGALVAMLIFVDSYSEMFAVTLAIEVLSLIRQPARESVVPQIVPERHLMAANGLNLLAGYGTAPMGSALFAALAVVGGRLLSDVVASPGIAITFAFDALTFLISAVILLPVVIPPVGGRAEEEEGAATEAEPTSPVRDMIDGFKFVGSVPVVRRMVLGMAAALFGGGALFVLGQPFSEQVLGGGDSGYGLVATALGLGAGLGMLVVTLWGRNLHLREPVFAAALVATGIGIVLASFTETVVGAAAWVFVAGLGTGIAYVTGFTHLHTVVSDDIRGRTFAALFALGRLALLVSFALAGVGAAAFEGLLPGMLSSGVRLVIVASGWVILASGAGTMWAVREQLRAEPLDPDSYESLRQAGDAATWVRGNRRPE
jgi:dTMP kinase